MPIIEFLFIGYFPFFSRGALLKYQHSAITTQEGQRRSHHIHLLALKSMAVQNRQDLVSSRDP